MIVRRKKTCAKCGRYLWLRDFYKLKAGGYCNYCKECSRQYKNEEYARNRKKPDRVYLDQKTGQAKEHKGYSTRLYWSEAKIEALRRRFPTTKNEDLALDLNVSPRTLVRKARELGIEKDKAWQQAHARRNCETMRLLNKYMGNSGQFKKGQRASPATEFKKKQ